MPQRNQDAYLFKNYKGIQMFLNINRMNISIGMALLLLGLPVMAEQRIDLKCNVKGKLIYQEGKGKELKTKSTATLNISIIREEDMRGKMQHLIYIEELGGKYAGNMTGHNGDVDLSNGSAYIRSFKNPYRSERIIIDRSTGKISYYSAGLRNGVEEVSEKYEGSCNLMPTRSAPVDPRKF
jgi:hypothetical protein